MAAMIQGVCLIAVLVIFVDADCTLEESRLVCDIPLPAVGYLTVEVDFKLCRENPTLSLSIDNDILDIHETKSGISDISIPVRAFCFIN